MDVIHYEKDNVSWKLNSAFMSTNERNHMKPSKDIEWGDLHDVPFSSQTRNPQQMFNTQYSRPTSVIKKSNICKTRNTFDKDIKCNECRTPKEPFCHVKLDSISKLRDSTKKLLLLLEEIQSKTHLKSHLCNAPNVYNLMTAVPSIENTLSANDVIYANALKRSEEQANNFDEIYIENDDDDCSVYKRLVRKCHCLNRREYNDFTIHFNEDTRYFTSTNGEIIKNMKILKKFLYMGGGYAKNALLFLNEGLSDSTYTEKVEIINGMSHADVCNMFEDYSIVTVHISWPCKYEKPEDPVSQSLAAGFIYKLAQSEEGRRYLKFSTKITNDIKKVIRKKASKLEYDTLESLNATLNLIYPPSTQQVNATYYCKPIDEGFGNKITQALIGYRQYMTLDEVFTHLDLLYNMSVKDHGKIELTSSLPSLLKLFKHMLIEYDSSEMNIIITNILNNVVPKNIMKEKETELDKPKIIANIATESTEMKNERNQIPDEKQKKNNRSKLGLSIIPNKFRQSSKFSDWKSSYLLSKSKKFTKDNRKPIIVVPIEE